MKAKKEKTGKDKIEVYKKIDGEFKKTDEKLVDSNSEELYGQKGAPFTPKEPITLNRVIFDSDKKAAWVIEIETICNEQGILPEDMVKEWKEMKTIPIKELRKYAKNGKELFNENEIKAIIGEKIQKNTSLSKELKQQLEKTRQEQLEQELIYVNKEIENRNTTGLSKWQLELRKKKLGI